MSATKKTSRGGIGVIFVLLLLAAVGAAAFWVMRETLDKGAPSLPGFLANATSGLTSPAKTGTEPAAPRGVAPMPGPQAATPPVTPPMAQAQPGAAPAAPAPGQSPAEQGTEPAASGTDGQNAGTPFIAGGGDDLTMPVNRAALPKVTEDSVVRLAFVDDLAAFLAGNYWPRGTHPSAVRSGISTVSVKWANLRYGGELQGMRRGDDLARARASVLRYVLTPSMLEGLYTLYIERFTAGLEAAADARRVGPAGKERALTPAEKKEMLQLYAAQARGLGAAINVYLADGAMRGRVEALHAAENAVNEANRAYMESAGAYDEAREAKAPGLDAAKTRMDKDAAVYQRAIQTRERTREDLVRAMKGGASRTAGDDTLVYVASWLNRRGTGNPEALRAAAAVLQKAGGRLAGAAKE